MRSILLLFILISSVSFSQSDTVTLVSYNLLNFPDGRDDCGSNMVVPNRIDTLRKIMQYSNPDIFVACEIQHEAGADSVLTRSLNVFGSTNYASATFHDDGTGYGLHNQLYYNTDKLILQWQDAIVTSVRNIDHYVLYVNDPSLGVYFDTTFIEVYMCHLKAGNGGTNAGIRAGQTQLLMDYIATRPSDRNHFICGDLNVYSSSESGYQNMVTGGLIDPINTPGSWNNNSSYADVHTQSTRSGSNYDCGSTGGTDDRFDQILVSNNVMQGSDSLKYLMNSYDAIGNDGNHFNTNLLANPTNVMYPDSIIRALYYMSDHMPVMLKAVVTYPTSNGLALNPSTTVITCNGGSDGTATVVPNDGQAPYTYLWDANANSQTTQTATNLANGSYCVQVEDFLGEIDSYCVYVSQPIGISYSTFLTPESNNCNGVVHLILGGGTPPYTVVWNDFLQQVGQSAYNLCAGTYEATVTDDNGCVSIIEIIIVDNTNSIDELESSSIKVYPNPVSDVLTIDFQDSQSECSIQILDSFGRLVLQNSVHYNESQIDINVSHLEQGIYILQFDFDQKREVRFLEVN